MKFNTQRRAFLRGLGTCVAIPAFASLARSNASEVIAASKSIATTPTGAPLRMAFMSIPNGVQQDHWFPTGTEKEFSLNSTMTPLEGLKSQIQIITGLKHDHATAGNDGAGDHARANATFLTAHVHARRQAKTSTSVFLSIKLQPKTQVI